MQHKYLAAGLCLVGAAAAGCGGSPAAGGQHPAPITSGAGIIEYPSRAPSDSAPAGASLAGIRACTLISAAVIKSVIGSLSQAPYQSPGGQACFYEPAVPGGTGPAVILTVTTRAGYEAAMSFAQGAAEAGATRYGTVTGLGDSGYAMWQSAGAPSYTLSAAVGSRAISIEVGSTSPASERQVRQLAEAAIARL